MSSKSGPDPGWRPWSLAARLTAWYAGSAFVLVLAATGSLYWALVASLDRDDDASLAGAARAVRAALRQKSDDPAWPSLEAEVLREGQPPEKIFLRLLREDGSVVVQTPGMEEMLPASAFPPPVAAEVEPGAGTDLRSPAGKPYRALAARARVGGDGGPARVVQVALDRTQEEELLAGFRRSLWLVLGLALVACTLAGYEIARRGLRPVAEVTDMARRIRPATLGQRLASAGLPAELRVLADTFNGMLERLEDSFGRLARFSADIAHELRTPVNNLRGEAEVALGKPRTPEEYREVLGSCLEECGRLSRLIDNLLFLARAEDPKTEVARERVDVAAELAGVQEFYEAAAAEAGVRLAVAPEGEPAALVNRPLFQRAIANLVANALAHTPPGGTITLTAGRDGDFVRVEVADDGPGIDPEHLPHLFDRFYRADPARASAGGRVGLGLAIVKSIAELHGGRVSLSSRPGHGTRVSLHFPTSAEPSPGPAPAR
jgi:two-component system heavy metal sensor histidine kinase CusS